ncbi:MULTISPECIES: transglycosylase domain-containing protein [Vagococcus]|uniref:Multimodular transpeptidase-transglycosylase n=1 Tax=Vagococcus fluvialis bH819 TaxID=1255619 RepID=A0A1X6WPB4_9ENTE|nr:MULTISPECIES: transglycosylase domain-containing protein [Vagococcus]SLM86135.1 Multimodular transpeptidase-transglycosylase [Vagococcus fluvialis bH819]HCM90383.1 penicillin-binding protein [Vagococcus sp.]
MVSKKKIKKKRKQSNKRRRLILNILGMLALVMMLSVSIGGYIISKRYSPYSSLLEIQDINQKITQSFVILDKNDQPLDENTVVVKFDPIQHEPTWNIDKLYLDTLLAVEDNSFYTRKTNGYSIKGTTGAVVSQVKRKLGKNVVSRGGSTIEQQLVKLMVFGTNNKNTVSDKIIQLIDARKLALKYDREDILKAYLNELRLTPNTVGVKAASIELFGDDMSKIDSKDPKQVAQVAFMAGLGQSPSTYIQDFNKSGKARTRTILSIMKENTLIGEDVYQEALAVVDSEKEEFTLKSYKQKGTPKEYQAYVSKVKDELSQLNLPKNVKITVKTYADANQLKELHKIAMGTYPQDDRLPNGYIEHKESLTALSVIETKTGHITGLATNSDNPLIPYTATRSSGSTIKPLLDYAPAVEYAGLTPDTIQNGSSFTVGEWKVKNYGNQNYGNVRASFALGLSLNSAAVEAFQMTNNQQKNSMMEPFGLNSYNQNGASYNPEQSINYPTNVLALSSAFSTFGNDGVRVEPTTVKSIQTDSGPIKLSEAESKRAMSSSTAKTMVSMLKEVTGANGSEPYAGPKYTGFNQETYVMKSGLSNFEGTVPNSNNKSPDALLAMASPELSIATWLGSPSYVDATYAPTSFPHDTANQGRVYLMNSAFKVMMEGRESKKFKFGNEKLIRDSQTTPLIPELDKMSDDDLDDITIKNKEIDKKESEKYDSLEKEYLKTIDKINRTYQE